MIAGILSYRAIVPRPVAQLVVAAALLLAVLIFSKRVFTTLFLAAALFLIGLTLAQLEAFYFPADHIAHFHGRRTQVRAA